MHTGMGNILKELQREHVAVSRLRLLRLSAQEVDNLRRNGYRYVTSFYIFHFPINIIAISSLKEGLHLAVDALGENCIQKLQRIVRNHNDQVGKMVAMGSSSRENAIKVIVAPCSSS